MMPKLVAGTILIIMLACLFQIGSKVNLLSGLRGHFFNQNTVSRNVQVDEQIDELSHDDKEAHDAPKALEDCAQRSRVCRQEVIDNVLNSMRGASPHDSLESHRLWVFGSGVLLELKAVEAMDL